MSIMSNSVLSIIAILFVTTSLPSLVSAQDVDSSGDDWQHTLAIYGWGTGIGGRTARGTGIDVPFHKLWDNLSFAIMGAYQAKKGKWSVLADGLYLDLSAKKTLDLIPPIGGDLINVTTDVKAGLDGMVLQLAGGYNLYLDEGTTTDFVFGARYLDLSTDLLFTFNLGPSDLDLKAPVSGSGNSLDAIIGLKGKFSMADRWFIPWYVDIGAGDSDFTGQVIGGVGFKASERTNITLVYRYLEWDLGGDVIDDLNFSGPALGVVFRF